MKYIKLRKRAVVIRFYFNKVLLGAAYREVDGFYVFVFEDSKAGAWSDYALREIADILTDLNQEYSNKLNEYMKENPPFSGPYPTFK